MKRLDPQMCFSSPLLNKDLTQRSVQGGIINLTSQSVQFVLRMTGMLVLVRILSPSDYGIMTMAVVVVNFVQVFKDAGLSIATVQTSQISHNQVSALFWLNVLISAVIVVMVLLASPFVATIFHRPELTSVTAALSISILVSGLAIQHDALLWRHMHFQSIAFIQIASLLANICVAVGMALLGFRYWSLVMGVIVQSITGALMTFYFCPWQPGKMKRDAGIRKMLAFGGHLTGFNIVNYFARNADNALIGKYIGADALGLYSRAYQLLMAPISQIRAPLDQVAMPVLSSLFGEPERYAKYYRRLLEVSLLVMVPLILLCALEAEFIVRLLLGPKWVGSVVVFRILALVGLIQAISTTRGLVMISSGLSGRYFQWGVFNSVVMVIAFVIGLPHGIVGVAAAYTIANYVILFPSLVFCFRGTPVTVSLFLSVFFPSLLAAVPAVAAIILAKQVWPGNSFWLHLMYSCIFIGAFVLISWCRRSVRETLALVLRVLRTRHEKIRGK